MQQYLSLTWLAAAAGIEPAITESKSVALNRLATPPSGAVLRRSANSRKEIIMIHTMRHGKIQTCIFVKDNALSLELLAETGSPAQIAGDIYNERR